jgi:hypothetical protein
VLSHHTLAHSHGAADENLDLHATLSLRHRNSILDSSLHSLSLIEERPTFGLLLTVLMRSCFYFHFACSRLPADMALIAILTMPSIME